MAPELAARVKARVEDCFIRAERHFGQRLPRPQVAFDLSGDTAGKAVFSRRLERPTRLRFNPVILETNLEPFLARTVPHEVAHCIAFTRHGADIRPHGPEWKAVMRLLGIEDPQRCHRYTVPSHAYRRKRRRHIYHCGCEGYEHKLSSVRHNRIQREGRQYRCRDCKQRLCYQRSIVLI